MIGFKLTDLFVDSALVEAKIEKAKVRSLKIVGFEVRRVAQLSMRDSNVPSRPGQPPHSHVGTLRDLILYSLDKEANSMVVGPKFLRKKSKDAAKAVEHGGQSMNTKGRVIRVQARPFMEPAFNRVNRSKVPAVFANSVQ